MDVRDGRPTDPSLFAISEARRAARAAGATVFAFVATAPLEPSTLEALASAIGRAGADRVLLCEGAALAGPPLDATHGRALTAAVERIPPLLVLFPAGSSGEELGTTLAARMGAAYARATDIEVAEEPAPLPDSIGRLVLRRWRADRTTYRRIDPAHLERPVIATLGAHGMPTLTGSEDIEVEVLSWDSSGPAVAVELAAEPDDGAAWPLAYGIVLVAPEIGAEISAELRAAAPAGVAVVEASPDSALVLETCSPAWLLKVGWTPVEVAASPRTRVGVVLPEGTELPESATVDLVWRLSGEQPWRQLADALGSLAVHTKGATP